MAVASLAFRTPVTAIQANCEVIASANNAYRALECGLSVSSNAASTFGMGFPAAVGVGPTNTVPFTFEDEALTSTPNTTSAVAWATTNPTSPAPFLRRVTFQATAGAGISWSFPFGVAVLKAKSLVMWNIVSSVPFTDVWWVIDE